ncbi:peptidyl-tRNA hydrolase [Thalassoporum mexicanum PCC 7367]|uniref:aminoacyl-tRNA hydrolase n=1 Tax=Thalassoporum mexicanum TaxID=3457544 RepID=UPI00029FF031|nr:aminoacyl-tRNA hydrolase [Pseudanabaena sp. PCC 7367]AFY70240.1 peptidyl-tRNA hydrolase [Pseudanabaena sp. PCC 7367]
MESSQIIRLIVGLGNPGAKYEGTRHNIGFMAIDQLARYWGASLTEAKKFHGISAEYRQPGRDRLILLKPTTYMNDSGRSARAVLDWYKLEPQSVLVIYDDMDLPLGKIRLRHSGSAGGHNGMKSMIAHLGTQDFPRLRLGIGKQKNDRQDTISHVLGGFMPAEQKILPQVLDLAQDTIISIGKQGIDKTMSLYNSRSVPMPLPQVATDS